MELSRLSLPALACAAITGALPTASAVSAEGYPGRPIRLIVPNAPGSSVDVIIRIVANRLGEAIGQQVVVDNRAGAGGIIGMRIGKEAPPDGYTLIAATTAASTIAVLLQNPHPFDPVKDFDYVMQFAVTPNVLVVDPKLPIKTVKELIDYCKARKGAVNMASAGAGSQSHLSGAYLLQTGRFESLHVPYKGGSTTTAIIAGESQWTFSPAAGVMSFVNSGRLRAIGQSLPKASALLPDIPSIADTIPGFEYSGWQGFMVPKGTSKAIIKKVRTAVIKTINLPDVKKALAAQGTEIISGTPEEFRHVVRASMVKNAEVVKAIGLSAN